MSEILFRGKRTDNGEWIEGYLYRIAEELNPFIMLVNRYAESHKVEAKTVGQFTGLTDKNGTKVFVGDVFKFDDEVWTSSYTSCGTEYDSCDCVNYGVVGFDAEHARYDFIDYKYYENSVEADLHENKEIDFAEFIGQLEIIGNIHDNPELMEVKEND